MSGIANQEYRRIRPVLQTNFVNLVVVDAVPIRRSFEHCHDLSSIGLPTVDPRSEPFC